MENTFDYSQVPTNFGLCASTDCTKASTCLRHIALKYAPEEHAFLPTLNPNKLKAMKGMCNYYRPNNKVRYAKGFTRLQNTLKAGAVDTFRWKLIAYFGRKNYYLIRKGDMLITPSDQEHIIRIANECGFQTGDYFDAYIEGYAWK